MILCILYTYVGCIHIYPEAIDQDLTESYSFPSKPVCVEYLVNVTIELPLMEQNFCHFVAGEYANTGAHYPAEI